MMNYLWAAMLVFGVAFAALKGDLAAFSDGLISSCTKAVYFVIGLAGIMAVWSGLMNIAKESGLMDSFSRIVKPLMKFIFPREKNKDTLAMMLMSFTANIFGAGNSATVFSIKTMVMLDKENRGSHEASDTMCMFLAVNMSMIQLVPITIIKIRSDAGSADPGSIILPSIIVGLISMVASIGVCKLFERKTGR
ncbi:MAG: nucleoside recognition domain-containing protein [Eubacteriales bacterium]|nr:nucleoside recognition domain-containing protein [Eubacteriales bacterium]